MLGSGLIKFRGDKIWRNGTALFYHFETQPIPGPFNRWFHFLPRIAIEDGRLVQLAYRFRWPRFLHSGCASRGILPRWLSDIVAGRPHL